MGCCSTHALEKAHEAEVQKEKSFSAKYVLGKKLGSGSFAQVRAIKERNDESGGRKLAVKIINLMSTTYQPAARQSMREAARQQLKVAADREAFVWQTVGSSLYCVDLLEVFVGRSLFFFVMERCRQSVLAWLDARPVTAEADLARIFREMLLGTNHVHEKGIVHRDIKPDNFLYGGPGGHTCKLADFGLADVKPKNKSMKGIHGTAPFMSPEMLAEGGYEYKTDIWSVGTTAYLILFGDFPYTPDEKTAAAMKQMILEGVTPPPYKRPAGTIGKPSEKAVTFVRALLERNPQLRPTSTAALELPFVAPVKEEEASKAPTVKEKGLAAQDFDLKKMFTLAKTHTTEFRKPADPTIQRDLDSLLQELTRNRLSRSFTTPVAGANDQEDDELDPSGCMTPSSSLSGSVNRDSSAEASCTFSDKGLGPRPPGSAGSRPKKRLSKSKSHCGSWSHSGSDTESNASNDGDSGGNGSGGSGAASPANTDAETALEKTDLKNAEASLPDISDPFRLASKTDDASDKGLVVPPSGPGQWDSTNWNEVPFMPPTTRVSGRFKSPVGE